MNLIEDRIRAAARAAAETVAPYSVPPLELPAEHPRGYGWRQRYLSESHGFNSRLDELQAAILRVKLRHLDEANEERRRRAALYDETLKGIAVPMTQPWNSAK